MPAYLKSPFPNIPCLLPGQPSFSFGDYRNSGDPTLSMSAPQIETLAYVSNVAISGNVATVTLVMRDGPVPVLTYSWFGVTFTITPQITIIGTQTATSGGAPNFNVTAAAVTGVGTFASAATSTVTFALVSSNISTTADSGMVTIVNPPGFETLPSSATAGLQYGVAAGHSGSDSQKGLTWFTQFTGSPATVTMQLQGANIDLDAYYTTVDTSTNASGEARSLSNISYNFYRIRAASTGGSSPTFIAGMELI